MSSTEETAAAPPPPRPYDPRGWNDGVPDWSQREFDLREWMDEPCTYRVYKRAAMDLAKINRVTRGYAATIAFLQKVLARTRVSHEPLHVVDVGCAHGDALRVISRWAAKRSVPLKLTGVDMNPYAARLARECDRNEHVSAGTIQWLTADAFAVKLDRPADVVLSSLFAHHLPNDAIARYLAWCEKSAKLGWFVGDLRRSERAALWFSRLAWAMRSCEMVKHDGVVSFRRALSVDEWKAVAPQAAVRDVGLGRVGVERLK